MNLLNNLFNNDDIEIANINKKYLLLVFIAFLIIVSLLIIKKDNYYQNSFNVVNEKLVLIVDNNYINEITNYKEIIINDIKCDYSIDIIEPLDSYYLVSININRNINISNGVYKIYLGKERMFDYIVRIIKK